jgi:hypothetical protein
MLCIYATVLLLLALICFSFEKNLTVLFGSPNNFDQVITKPSLDIYSPEALFGFGYEAHFDL